MKHEEFNQLENTGCLDNLGLSYVETTSNGTGYPEKVEKAIIGFDDIEQAQEFAKAHGLHVVELWKQAGWNFWVRSCETIEAFDMWYMYAKDDNNILFSDEVDFLVNFVKPRLLDFRKFDQLTDFVEKCKEISDAIKDLSDEEFVVTRDGRYVDTLPYECMQYEYDSKCYAIAVI